jgi:cell wall-associated NlpC family hydrolase
VLVFQQHQQLLEYQRASAGLLRQRDAVALATAQVRNQRASLARQRSTIEAKIDKLRELRRRVYGSATASPPRHDRFTPEYSSGPAGQAIRYAFAQIGKGYRFGADGPGSYDCSGLVMASWRSAGVNLAHSAATQWRLVAHLNRDQLQPGDLVFYYSDIHHVALYIGGGRVVHAPTWGQAVTIAPIDVDPVHGYGRVRG